MINIEKITEIPLDKILELNNNTKQEAKEKINFFSRVKNCQHEWKIQDLVTPLDMDKPITVKTTCNKCGCYSGYKTSFTFFEYIVITSKEEITNE